MQQIRKRLIPKGKSKVGRPSKNNQVWTRPYQVYGNLKDKHTCLACGCTPKNDQWEHMYSRYCIDCGDFSQYMIDNNRRKNEN